MMQIIMIVVLACIFAPRGVENVWRTSGFSDDYRIPQTLNPVVNKITDESVTHGKTLVAQQYERHYGVEVQEYGKKPRLLAGYIIPSGENSTRDLMVEKIDESLCATLFFFTGKTCPKEGELSEEERAMYVTQEVTWENGLKTEFGDWEDENLTMEEKRAIISKTGKTIEEFVFDYPRTSESQCMTEGNCNSNAENPEPEATARDGLGGSHGAWQYRTRANLPGLSDICRKARECSTEERRAIWESIKCSHHFECSTIQRNELTLEKNKPSWDVRGKSDEDRLENTREMVFKHNGAKTPEAQATYLAPFNEYMVSLGGTPL